jgi:glycosyltransferase involved in cell wall biosynthesis
MQRPTTTSIIITTHERPHLLRRSVESAFAAGVNVEVIVVDDASNDETRDVCKTLCGIKYVRVDKQQGVAGARNIGLSISTGDYITFLDDDDLRLPLSIDRQVELLETNPEAALVYGQAVCLNQAGQPSSIYPEVCLQGDVLWNLLVQNFIPCGSAVFRRTCLDKVGRLETRVSGIDDWDLWVRLAELFPIIALPEPVFHWRRPTPSSKQGTSNASAIVSACVGQYRGSWSKLARLTHASEKRRRDTWDRFITNLAAHLNWEIIRCLRHRNFWQATKNMFALVQLGPLAWIRLVRRYGNIERGRRLSVVLLPQGEKLH